MSDHETVVPIPPTDTAEIVCMTKTEYDALTTTIATQAARVLELEVAYQEFSAIIANEGDEIAKLEAELAEATGQLLSWHYDTKHEWGFPFSEKAWASNPLRQRYKELTGVDWIEPVETDMEDDDDDE